VDAAHGRGVQAGNFNRQTNVFQVSTVAVARRAVFLPPRRRVMGRQELLDQLWQELVGGTANQGAGPAVLVLHGLGGVGKSSLALEYAHRHWIAEDYGLVWWVTATQPAAVGTQLGTLLAAQLEADVEGRDSVAMTQAVLAARTEPWLLVLDDAENPDAVREFLPPAGSGHVLITSRNPNWHPHARLEVPDLHPAAAVAFLTARTGDPDEVSAEQLAEQLGHLPLGLEQAGAYISATPGATLASYLTAYRKRRPELLGRGDPADYEHTIARTWSMAFGALGSTAVGLLRLLACYAPDDIPLTLLLSGGVEPADLTPEPGQVLERLIEDELELDDALAALYRYSLVRSGSVPGSPTDADSGAARGGRTVSVHRLVQAVVRDQLSDEQRAGWGLAARMLLGRTLPADPEDPAGWPVFTALLPHLLTTFADTDGALQRAARFLHVCGDYRSAQQVLERAIAGLGRVLGEKHPDTLTARANLAGTLYALGELEAASRVLGQVASARSEVLGPEHPSTLSARTNLALALWHLGRRNEAREVLQQVLDGLVLVLGRQDRATGSEPGDDRATVAQLADWSEARLPVEDVLQARLQGPGPGRPTALTIQGNTALSVADLRGLGEAGRLLARMEQALLHALGPDHPDTLTNEGNLAFVLAAAGQLAAARRVLEGLVAARLRVSGPEHPATLTAQGGLAATLAVLGESGEARRLLEQVVSTRVRVLGHEHPDTLTAEANLGLVLAGADEWCAARRVLEPVVDGLVQTLGPEHPDSLTARGNLAAVLAGAGERCAARSLLEPVVQGLLRVLGPDHPATVSARVNLAVVDTAAADPGA
jgi:tetratricopeptide (TPR) repeat protein